jgi:hypothetical protein
VAGRRPAAEIPAHLLNVTDAELLEQAINLPGRPGETYTRFINLSLGNQALLLLQGVNEPVNTFSRWRDDLNRNVIKGAKAKYIRRPIFKKVEENGKEEQRLVGFKLVKCMFGVSDTEGEDLPDYETPVWSTERALGSLGITRVAFEGLNGNMQGWSTGREFALNPVAAWPLKTTIHEISHIEHGHTAPGAHEEYATHRGLREFEAEGSAYLVMHQIGAEDQFDAAESRNYIRRWLRQDVWPPDESMRRVLRVADRITKAGRPVEAEVSHG